MKIEKCQTCKCFIENKENLEKSKCLVNRDREGHSKIIWAIGVCNKYKQKEK